MVFSDDKGLFLLSLRRMPQADGASEWPFSGMGRGQEDGHASRWPLGLLPRSHGHLPTRAALAQASHLAPCIFQEGGKEPPSGLLGDQRTPRASRARWQLCGLPLCSQCHLSSCDVGVSLSDLVRFALPTWGPGTVTQLPEIPVEDNGWLGNFRTSGDVGWEQTPHALCGFDFH